MTGLDSKCQFLSSPVSACDLRTASVGVGGDVRIRIETPSLHWARVEGIDRTNAARVVELVAMRGESEALTDPPARRPCHARGGPARRKTWAQVSADPCLGGVPAHPDEHERDDGCRIARFEDNVRVGPAEAEGVHPARRGPGRGRGYPLLIPTGPSRGSQPRRRHLDFAGSAWGGTLAAVGEAACGCDQNATASRAEVSRARWT